MSDEGDFWRDVRDDRRERRAREGINCPGCKKLRPRACPTRLMPPNQKCKVCGTAYKQALKEVEG